MSITNPQVIDIWAMPTGEPNNVVLYISDHLEWGTKAEQGEHLQLLQDKLNTYVAFIESGEIYTEIPNALGKHPVICINGLYELSEQGEFFIERAAEVLKEVGIGLEFALDENEAIRNM